MRPLLRTLVLLRSNVIQNNRTSLRNFARVLSQQQQVTVTIQESLRGRLFQYLNIDKAQSLKASPYKIELLKIFRQNQKQLYKLSNNEIVSFLSSLEEQSISRSELLLILRELDIECCLRLSELSTSDLFEILNVYMRIIPTRITEFKFYKRSVSILYDSLHNLSSKDLIQLIFYIGLQKKNLDSQTMLRECLKVMNPTFIQALTSEELCIICNSTFKTSTKIINKVLLEKVRGYINDNLSVLKDSALFVTLIKTLRHNRYQNEELLNTISCCMFFNKTFTFYSFPIVCHLMALFADYFFYDERFFKTLTKMCLEQVNESKFVSKNLPPSEQLRAKDLKTFLWIMSMFSEMKLVSHDDLKNVIMPKLIERIEGEEFDNDLDYLIDITLYLWMLNYQAYELVPYIFNKKNRQLLAVKPKTNLRLNLLLQAIQVENPELFKKISTNPISIPTTNYSISYQLHKRPLISRLMNNLERMKKQFGLNKFEVNQEIPHLNIIGITGYKNACMKAVHVEILDDYTRIKNLNTDVPVGLMALKLRLLDKSEQGVLVMSQREIEEMDEEKLNDYLLDEIKLIC